MTSKMMPLSNQNCWPHQMMVCIAVCSMHHRDIEVLPAMVSPHYHTANQYNATDETWDAAKFACKYLSSQTKCYIL